MACPRKEVCRCEEVRHEDTYHAKCWLGCYSPVDIKRICSDIDPSTFHSRFPCKSYEEKRADERTRTADLLITSETRGVAVPCRGLQNPHA